MSETIHLLNEGSGRASLEVRAFWGGGRGHMLQFTVVDARTAVFIEATYEEVEQLNDALAAWLFDRHTRRGGSYDRR